VNRLDRLQRFYELLDQLSDQLGGPRTLDEFSNYRDWPARGVYFFFEPGEARSDSGEGLRVVRVGTHALTSGSRSTLRQRLSQHRGTRSGGGNHRGSIFRLLVGQALIAQGTVSNCKSWGVKGSKGDAVRSMGIDRQVLEAAEAPVERTVSDHIGRMPFLWLSINDEPGSASLRGLIERNSIALLTNQSDGALDSPSSDWLGLHSNRSAVVRSGLWNQRHTDEHYDPAFLDEFSRLIELTKSPDLQ